MTDELTLWPADMRRGSSILAHAATQDRFGVDTVLAEAKDAGRSTELTAAVIGLVVDGFPGFCTPVNAKTYSDAAAKYAAHEIDLERNNSSE
jgi:hypothetical protein